MVNQQVLIANRQCLQQNLERIEEVLAVADNGSFRQGDEEFEKGDALSVKQVARQNHIHSKEMRNDIIAALERMDEGVYGTCVKCGREISEDRLFALPYAGTCINCRKKIGLRVK